MPVNLSDDWEQALSYDDYVGQMTTRQDEYKRNFERARIDGDTRRRFDGSGIKFLALTEDWCGDSAQFLPVAARLAAETDGMEIRMLRRDQHLELADNYRDASGRQPIPVIILLDEQLDQIGYLLERPARASELMAAETRRFAGENSQLDGIRRAYANMPEETRKAVSANMANWRAAQQDEFAGYLLDELAAIAGQRQPA